MIQMCVAGTFNGFNIVYSGCQNAKYNRIGNPNKNTQRGSAARARDQ